MFSFSAFEDSHNNTMLSMRNNPEDEFIENMALGKLLQKGPNGSVVAGSLEGIVAEIIKVFVSILI